MIKVSQFFLASLLSVFVAAPLPAQVEPQKEFNALYQPISVIQRLSYDNFKAIKLLHAAVMNYGGGEAEIDRLVDAYADASALFFQNKIIESANLFTKNEKDIKEVAKKVASIYRNETDQLHIEIIKMNVRYKIKNQMKDDQSKAGADKAVASASFGVQKANDLYERLQYVDAIYFFRRAKEQCFKLYNELDVPLPDKYKKDMVDNQNKVYESKNKQI